MERKKGERVWMHKGGFQIIFYWGDEATAIAAVECANPRWMKWWSFLLRRIQFMQVRSSRLVTLEALITIEKEQTYDCDCPFDDSCCTVISHAHAGGGSVTTEKISGSMHFVPVSFLFAPGYLPGSTEALIACQPKCCFLQMFRLIPRSYLWLIAVVWRCDISKTPTYFESVQSFTHDRSRPSGDDYLGTTTMRSSTGGRGF